MLRADEIMGAVAAAKSHGSFGPMLELLENPHKRTVALTTAAQRHTVGT